MEEWAIVERDRTCVGEACGIDSRQRRVYSQALRSPMFCEGADSIAKRFCSDRFESNAHIEVLKPRDNRILSLSL